MVLQANNYIQQVLPVITIRPQPLDFPPSITATTWLHGPTPANPVSLELPRKPLLHEEQLVINHRRGHAAVGRSQEGAPRVRELVRERPLVTEAVALEQVEKRFDESCVDSPVDGVTPRAPRCFLDTPPPHSNVF